MNFPSRISAPAALAAAASLALWAALAPALGAVNDDAVFILLARALRQGRYLLPDGFDLPVTNPLPGLPALLCLPVWLMEPRWDFFRALGFAWSLGCLALAWRLFRQRLTPQLSLMGAAILASTPAFAVHAGLMMPDVPYLAVSLALFSALPGAGRRFPLHLALGAAAACLLRPEGFLLALSLGAALWLRLGPARAWGFLAVALGPLGAWTLRNALAARTATDYVSNLRGQLPDLWNWPDQLSHGGRLLAMLGGGLTGLSGAAWLRAAAGAVVLALASLGIARALRRKDDVQAFAMACYAILFLCLHLAWAQVLDRYLLAILPIAWLFLLLGLKGAIAPAFCGLVLCLQIRLDYAVLKASSETSSTLWPRTMAWVRENTDPQAKFQSASAPAVMLLGKRAAVPLFDSAANHDHWLAKCRHNGIGYILIEGDLRRWRALPPQWAASLRRTDSWTRSSPHLRRVYADAAEATEIFQVIKEQRYGTNTKH